MGYDRQRETALRLVKKYGSIADLTQTTSVSDPVKEWKSVVTTSTVEVFAVTFADDGVTFVNHNIQGDTRVATVVSKDALKMQVGDTLAIQGRTFTVKLARPLEPDMQGAISWSALIV